MPSQTLNRFFDWPNKFYNISSIFYNNLSNSWPQLNLLKRSMIYYYKNGNMCRSLSHHFLSELHQMFLTLIHILLVSFQCHLITTLTSRELDVDRELVHYLPDVLTSLTNQSGDVVIMRW